MLIYLDKEMNYLDFLSPGKKIKNIRTRLNIKQIELEQIGVSRNFISMVESDKRCLGGETLSKLVEFFKNKAILLGIELDITEADLLLSEMEEAKNYCDEKLKTSLTIDEINSIISIGEKYNLIEVLSKSYTLKGNYLYEIKNYKTAFIFYNKALEIYIETQNNSAKPYIYNKLGKCKLMELFYEESLLYFLNCLFYSREISDKKSEKNCLYNIALVYKRTSDYDNSLVYINKFLNICEPNINFNEYIGGIILKSNCYLEKNENETAIGMFNDILVKYENRLGPLLGYIYNSLGLLYMKSNKIKLSLEYFDKAISVRQNTDMSNLSHTLIDKSKVYIKQKMITEAISLIEKGITLAKKFFDREYIFNGYSLLEELYINIGNIEKLEEIYLELVKILDISDLDKLIDIYVKLSIIYLDERKYDECRYILSKLKDLKAKSN